MKISGMVLFLGLTALALAVVSGVEAGSNAAKPAAASVVLKVDPDQIDFLIGKELVTRYHKGEKVAKPYCWPVNGTGGIPLTRSWPMEKAQPGGSTDHVHQKSAWFCYGDVIPEGLELKQKVKGVEGVDFWSEAPGHGKIVCVKVEKAEQAKNHGKVVTHNEWRTADGVKIMDETRTIHLHDLGAAQLLVLEIDLQASVVPIVFADTKEGAMGIRVRPSINVKEGKGTLTNAEGHTGEGAKNNADKSGCWGLISAWCDYTGDVEGKTAGIALFADPTNPSPSCWHARDYGLLA